MTTKPRYRTKVLRLVSGLYHWQVFDFTGAVYDNGKAPTQTKARGAVRAAKAKLAAP